MILAHNYQVPEIQDVAHYTGDSLGLSRRAAADEATTIAFCGVHFMAETAAILSPEKTVLIPDLDAGCSLADSITAEELRAWKAKHGPDAVVVMYVNTSAEVKAETDYCCTSSNAVKVVEHILREHGPETEILFGPDMWLGAYVERVIGRSMHVWPGECHVHAGIRPDDIAEQRAAHPGAEFLDPPRVRVRDPGDGVRRRRRSRRGGGPHALDRADARLRRAAPRMANSSSPPRTGCCTPLHKAAPNVSLVEANRMAYCKYMKMITLPKLRDALREMKFEVAVPREIADRARIPIERMVAIG